MAGKSRPFLVQKISTYPFFVRFHFQTILDEGCNRLLRLRVFKELWVPLCSLLHLLVELQSALAISFSLVVLRKYQIVHLLTFLLLLQELCRVTTLFGWG